MGLVSRSLYAGAHLVELGNMHEPVFKHRLYDGAGSFYSGKIRHERRLYIRRKARIRQSLDVGGVMRPQVSPYDQVVITYLDLSLIHI